MLTIQTMFDVLVHVDLVDYLVCVVLEGSREDHDLVELGHELDEVDTTWTYQEVTVTTVFYIMNQSLIQIKHQRVPGILLLTFQLWQEWRCNFR